MKSERTIVLHDFFNTPDGGGKVATILAGSFHSELFTGELNKNSFPDGYFRDVNPKSLEAYETSSRWLRFSKIFQLWWAFAHFPAASTSWTIFSGSFSPLAHRKIAGKKIFYCLTPPRLLYDQRGFMVEQVPGWQRPLLRVVMSLYRLAYERAVRGMDIIITISETVRARTIRYLGHDSSVVYPPCETERFQWIEEGNYFLSTARVDSLKRVDLIVRAFKEMPDKRLVVVSGGVDLSKIKRMTETAQNIDVLGWVDDEKLCDLMGRCIATIYIPRDEDFGISPVESMAAGKPVIGVQEGGLLETVGDDRGQWTEVSDQRSEEIGEELLVTDCGVLMAKDPGVEDVVEAVEWMTPERVLAMRESCEERAKRFDTDVFVKKMRGLIEGEVSG
ncbi:MAG: glycosyltransferase [Deltaproteobacteria bacterium]|nr:glycosyltransferase [Deltaproteobacteria bacterium]